MTHIGVVISIALLGAGFLNHLRAADQSLDVDALSRTTDVREAARALAIDYPELVKLAAAGNEKPFLLFAWLTRNGGFDGASSEAHAEILWRLILRLGDERASIMIRGISQDILLSVAEAVWGVHGPELAEGGECPQSLLAKSPRVMRFLQRKLAERKTHQLSGACGVKP